jgi:hypothetical protein
LSATINLRLIDPLRGRANEPMTLSAADGL